MEKPCMGHILHHVATVDVPDIAGQGIAWDHFAEDPTLYGIYRPDKTVIVTAMPDSIAIAGVAASQSCGTVHTNMADFST